MAITMEKSHIFLEFPQTGLDSTKLYSSPVFFGFMLQILEEVTAAINIGEDLNHSKGKERMADLKAVELD